MKTLQTIALKNVSAEFLLALGMIAIFMILGYYSREFALDMQALAFGIIF